MRAVIFDMDGVVADTQSYHAKVEAELLARRGVHLTPEEITARFASRSPREWFLDVIAPDQLEGALREKAEGLSRLRREDIRPMPGIPRLLSDLHDNGILLAVASSSPPEFIERVIAALGFGHFFSAIVSAHDVQRSKPAPDIFLLAAQRLGVAPKECTVIEDGVNGMQGAKAAGMRCIGLLGDPLRSYPADMMVHSFEELDWIDAAGMPF